MTGIAEGGPGCQRDVLNLGQWTYAIVNDSVSPNAAAAYLQMSPDANTWMDDSASVTIAYNGVKALVANTFLKYSRVYYYALGGTASAVTLNIFFQGNAVE